MSSTQATNPDYADLYDVQLLDPEELALALRVSRSWVLDQRKNPIERVPLNAKLIRFRRKDVDQFIKNQMRKAAEELPVSDIPLESITPLRHSTRRAS